MKKSLAVLITVYNRKSTTIRSLKQVYQQQPQDTTIDIWMTDDGCTDGTAEEVRELFPSVNIIKGDGSLFWNRGMHAAWLAASSCKDYDYYLWLNDDTFLFEGALMHLLQTSESMQDQCIIAGYTVNSNQDTITYGGRNENLQLIDHVEGITPCSTFNGNTVLIPRYVYEKVGQNDPYFHHGIGDTDYGLRAKKIGIESYIAPNAVGKCDAHTSLPIWANPKYPLSKRLKSLYAPGGNGSNPIEFFVFNRRHHGLLKACMYFVSNHLHAMFPSLWQRDASKY